MDAWSLMQSAARADSVPRSVPKGTLPRIWRFAHRHHRMLAVFLTLATASAVIGVATPVLAGRVISAITSAAPASTVVMIALVIAGLAVVDAGLTLAERWLSSRIGEGLIYDLRLAVFSHVQRMPLAFFTRTRTGSLVSRLNNDVIGAQRAFTSTLSGLVTNSIQLVLAVVVMVALAWQVTLLALILLPIFILPARRMGRRIAALQRESADLNASMTGQMTERFSAGGATLVKLFGRPQAEADEFGDRADRVRAVGVRTAMVNRVFLTCLTLVSALAQALVYGLGGWLAVTGTLDAGTVVALALLLTRLYSPLTSLANARVDVMSALVSFERVFEVLDLEPVLTEPETPTPLPAGPLGVRLRDVRFTYPSASEVSLASLEEVARLDDRVGAPRCCTASACRWRPAACSRWSARRARGSRRSPRCCPGSTTSTAAGSRSAGWTCASCPSPTSGAPWASSPRTGTSSTTPCGPTWPTPPRRRRTRSCARRWCARGSASCSTSCRPGWTRWWGSGGTGSPAGSASG